MKKYYIAVQVEENEKFYAYAIKVSKSENLISKLNVDGIVTANICQNRKEAESMVNHWNAIFKLHDNYMFDLAPF